MTQEDIRLIWEAIHQLQRQVKELERISKAQRNSELELMDTVLTHKEQCKLWNKMHGQTFTPVSEDSSE